MYLEKNQKSIGWAFLISLVAFSAVFVLQKNYEFIGYVVIVVLLAWALLASNRHVRYPNYVLWGLLIWANLHMLGGVEMANGNVIYTLMLWPIIDAPYSILKYDQVIHALGFFVATLVMHSVLVRHLVKPFGWFGVGIVLAMAGLGLGAVNEIIEFMMTVLLPNTNVGGYENTAIDLISNLIGAILAVFYLKKRSSKKETTVIL